MTEFVLTVAVTRNGRGDLWTFSSAAEAIRHPLVQYGDAIISCGSDIQKMFSRTQINEFLRKLDDEELRVDFMTAISDSRNQREITEAYDLFAERVWKRAQKMAKSVPKNADEVFSQIVYDRDHYNDGLPKERTMNDTTQTTEEQAVKTPKAPKYNPDAKIVMLADQEGKAYGADNNPKRVGSKSHDRFAHYGNGTTVAEFVAAGGTVADIDNDIKKLFIKVQ